MRISLIVRLLIASVTISQPALAAEDTPQQNATWEVGTPIVNYWAGPPLTDAVARQMADGGFNLVWCTESELDVAHRHDLRGQLRHPLLSPDVLDTPAQRERLAELITRVRDHPALYSYYITDEPSAAEFPKLGKLVAYLNQLDPQHLAYINLFPTYANNKQLGTTGDTVTAYKEHLRQYVQVVKPALISYDHYQFATDGDTDQYFLNLAMIRRASRRANTPFLNIVQACSWTPVRRVPQGNEMRYLVYTTLAYGARGISYYVYCHPGHRGGIALADGTPTPIYQALKTLNREFVAIAEELEPLQSIAVYHAGMLPSGANRLPDNAPFRFQPALPDLAYQPPEHVRGVLLGYFGASDRPSHVMVVNLDYQAEAIAPLVGPGPLETFDPTVGSWSSAADRPIQLRLAPGGGRLLRVARGK